MQRILGFALFSLIAGPSLIAAKTPAETLGSGPDSAAGLGEGFPALLGQYPVSREGSGTGWQPEATPTSGLKIGRGSWSWRMSGVLSVAYTRQGGPRGDDTLYSPNVLTLNGSRPAGAGVFGVRTMWSAESVTVGDPGYAELFQTGTTGDGANPMVDRQHPHDMFSELAVTYSLPVRTEDSLFAYLGVTGDPALGTTDSVRRFSGMDFPEAPLSYDWFDSSHTQFGVASFGYVWGQFKLEGSVFTGRRPDQHRSDITTKLRWPRFDSQSVRLTYNPSAAWSFQVSYGNVISPEQLQPQVDVTRITASGAYHRSWGANHWQTLLAWGQNQERPGHTYDSVLLESALVWHDAHTFLGRLEWVEKDALFPPGHPQAATSYSAGKASVGYIFDFAHSHHLRFGAGAVGSVHLVPDSLQPTYGSAPLSLNLFVRAKL